MLTLANLVILMPIRVIGWMVCRFINIDEVEWTIDGRRL